MTLEECLEQLERADTPCAALDHVVCDALGVEETNPVNDEPCLPVTRSLDTAVGLVLQVLPEAGSGHEFHLMLERQTNSGLLTATLSREDDDTRYQGVSRDHPALALCTALVRAKLDLEG